MKLNEIAGELLLLGGAGWLISKAISAYKKSKRDEWHEMHAVTPRTIVLHVLEPHLAYAGIDVDLRQIARLTLENEEIDEIVKDLYVEVSILTDLLDANQANADHRRRQERLIDIGATKKVSNRSVADAATILRDVETQKEHIALLGKRLKTALKEAGYGVLDSVERSKKLLQRAKKIEPTF